MTNTIYTDNILEADKHYRVAAHLCVGCMQVTIQTVDASGRTNSEMYFYADQPCNMPHEAMMAGVDKLPQSVRFSVNICITLLQLKALSLEHSLAAAG